MYKIKMTLLSETIFGSGFAVPSSVDLEVVYDEYGFPFMKAKTLKGNLRENMEKIEVLLGKEYEGITNRLLGKEDDGERFNDLLKFSDLRISKNIREVLIEMLDRGELDSREIKNSLTDERTFTSLNSDGSVKDGSLRTMRVIEKGLILESEISSNRKLDEDELELLSLSVASLKHIGSMRSRGKGEVSCELVDGYGEKINII